ncbi:MAG TPA: hypothetical protein VFL46_12260 [Phycicoccus sp.]|nr:hypothetical protein [Phycicoccus sp.]
MLAVVLGMLLCLALALAVLVVVAVPARRSGRDVLTERGEEVVDALRERGQAARSLTTRGHAGRAAAPEQTGASRA